LTSVAFVRNLDAIASSCIPPFISTIVSVDSLSFWQCCEVDKAGQTTTLDITLNQMWDLYHHDNRTLFPERVGEE
jgi:hypothetical protein